MFLLTLVIIFFLFFLFFAGLVKWREMFPLFIEKSLKFDTTRFTGVRKGNNYESIINL
jgi:hypothetical protein